MLNPIASAGYVCSLKRGSLETQVILGKYFSSTNFAHHDDVSSRVIVMPLAWPSCIYASEIRHEVGCLDRSGLFVEIGTIEGFLVAADYTPVDSCIYLNRMGGGADARV